MTQAFDLSEMPGWTEMVDYFGFEPTFHDAEVIGVDFKRSPLPITISIHTWRMTNEVDAKGFYVLDRHATVNFILLGGQIIAFKGWNHQNVLSEISIMREVSQSGISRTVVHLNSIFGLEAHFDADTVVVELIPGNPTKSDASPE
ncbi:MAG: Imm50 family immunity protein [Mesorhizobium sp.]